MNKLLRTAQSLLFERQGTLTRELLREPGGFGLGQVPSRLKPDTTTTAVCGFCSTGCGLDIHLKGDQVVNLTPAKDYPVNLGMACPKGWEALTPLKAKDRATTPMLKNDSGQLRPVDWPLALSTFVQRMKAIQGKYGEESCAFLSTGQIPSEEMFFLGSLAKFGMGMQHGDGNTRQCMATAVVAYKQAFGFDAPPYTYADFEESDVLVFVGANPCIAHPILWERVCRNRHQPEIIVVDPRRTETAMAATLHVSLNPKSDLCLFYGVARALIARGAIQSDYIAAHTEGFDAFRAHVEKFDEERVLAETGLERPVFERLVTAIEKGKRVSFWWTMGVNQSYEGVKVAQALINLALMTGNIGRPGTGANSITGQCNAMGSRLFSNTTNLLGGYSFEDPVHREKVASALGIPETRIPRSGSLAYDQILEQIHRGKIKGLWIIATNTAHSWINQADARALLGRLEFLVVQDMFVTTETAELAHLVLPAAGWGEKDGTFINSERRLMLLKKVARAPGQALSDFQIFRLLAEAWGVGEMFEKFREPEDVFHAMRAVSRGQPCDISGITGYEMIDRLRGVQWPLREGEAVEERSERRLFEDGRFFTQSGRAKFIFADPRPIPEATTKKYPLVLLTGRGTSAQWHTQTRTAKSPVLRKLYSQDPYVEINPKDARELGVNPGQWVTVESARGKMRARAHVTQIVSPGQVFIPMHYPETNLLTFPAFDEESRQPSYKHSAVRVLPSASV